MCLPFSLPFTGDADHQELGMFSDMMSIDGCPLTLARTEHKPSRFRGPARNLPARNLTRFTRSIDMTELIRAFKIQSLTAQLALCEMESAILAQGLIGTDLATDQGQNLFGRWGRVLNETRKMRFKLDHRHKFNTVPILAD
jgi:hypothetical protein